MVNWLKSLLALPTVARLMVVELKPDDVIVIESDRLLSQEEKVNVRRVVDGVWPGRRCLVLDRDFRLGAVRGFEQPGGGPRIAGGPRLHDR